MAEVLARKNDPAYPPVMLGNAMTQLKEGRAVNCDGGIYDEHPRAHHGIRLTGSQGDRIDLM